MATDAKQNNLPTDAAGFVGAVLGVKVDADKPATFITAIDHSFPVGTDANGRLTVSFDRQPFVNVPGDGATLTGARLTDLERARTSAREIRRLLQDVPPLVDDGEDAGTVRSLLFDTIDDAVKELAKAEGPLVPMIETLSGMIGKQFEELKERLGYVPECVNTVEQELAKTAIDTAGRYVSDFLHTIHHEERHVPASIGTQGALIGRELMCIAEGTQQLIDALDEAGVADPGCATVKIEKSTVPLGSFLDTLADFAQNDAVSLIAQGTDGFEFALTPTLRTFAQAIAWMQEHNESLFSDDKVKATLSALEQHVKRAHSLAAAIKRESRDADDTPEVGSGDMKRSLGSDPRARKARIQFQQRS